MTWKPPLYGELLAVGGRRPVAAQARRFSAAIRDGVRRASEPPGQASVEAMRRRIDEMLERVEQVRP